MHKRTKSIFESFITHKAHSNMLQVLLNVFSWRLLAAAASHPMHWTCIKSLWHQQQFTSVVNRRTWIVVVVAVTWFVQVVAWLIRANELKKFPRIFRRFTFSLISRYIDIQDEKDDVHDVDIGFHTSRRGQKTATTNDENTLNFLSQNFDCKAFLHHHYHF